MPTLHYILRDGSRRSVEAHPGSSVMENALRLNVRGIDAECGGSCICATCHVHIDEAFIGLLSPPDEMERELLDGVVADLQAGSRLGCQILVTAELDGLVVRVPQAAG